jgi:GNAT superfamily N-acetyltransferase
VELGDDFGLPVALADVDEALALRPDDAPPGVALVRVLAPPAEHWAALARAGFVRKPAWLTWLAPAGSSEEEFLAGLATKARQDMRRAARRAAQGGLVLRVHRPVPARGLDEFLEIYQRRIAQMSHGVGFAGQLRDSILASARDVAVFAYDDGVLVGGCLCLEAPEEGALRLRFSAVEPGWRAESLARVIYLEAFRWARERGYRWVTLGNDPNLYGHVAKAGLYFFKARLGFNPVPAGAFGAGAFAGDQADLLVSLAALADPVLMLEYADRPAGPGGFPALTARLFSRRTGHDPARYTTRWVTGCRFTPVAR